MFLINENFERDRIIRLMRRIKSGITLQGSRMFSSMPTTTIGSSGYDLSGDDSLGAINLLYEKGFVKQCLNTGEYAGIMVEITDEVAFENYYNLLNNTQSHKSEDKKPKIQYRKGRLVFGKIAKYSPNKDYIRDILDFLWKHKAIQNGMGEFLPRKSGNPLPISSLANEIMIKENGEERVIGEKKLRQALGHLNKEISKIMPIKISQRNNKALLILGEQ